jgi:hypothetical protein
MSMENDQTPDAEGETAVPAERHGEVVMLPGLNKGAGEFELRPTPSELCSRSIAGIDISDMATSSKLIVARHYYGKFYADAAVEMQEDVMTVTQRPFRYHNGSELVEDGCTNRHQLKFVCKRYLVPFESVRAILDESSLGTRRFLAAIRARAWTLNGLTYYALNEVLSGMAGR